MSGLSVLIDGRKIGSIPAGARKVVARIARLRGFTVQSSANRRRKRNKARRPRKLKFGSPAWRKKYMRKGRR